MIDASRLSHSLATALKDRPHGIPSQPNRSLPLRPPPPLPVRNSLTKSPKNTPINQAHNTQKETQDGGNFGTNITKRNTKERNSINDKVPSLGVARMNFYDSKDKEDKSDDKYVENSTSKKPKDVKSRHAKSLDNCPSDVSNCGDKRRKSLDHETIRPNGDTKKRNISNFEWDKSGTKIVQREKERRNSSSKKRKLSSAEENPDISRKEKATRVQNFDAVHPSVISKAVSQTEAKEPVTKSKYYDRVESSGMVLPTIFKYRNTGSTSPSLTDKNISSKATEFTGDNPSWKKTMLNTFKFILPKPANIPECPAAIPIEVAHAMNQADSRNSNIHLGTNNADIIKRQMSNTASITNQSDSTKPKINEERSKTHIPEMIEEIENILPSMPSLEDMIQAGSCRNKLTPRKNQVDTQKAVSNVGKGPMPIIEAGILQVPGDLTNKTSNLPTNESIQRDISPIHDHKLNKSHESIVNQTTILEIQIPGRSPELIILQTPQIMSNGNVNGMASNSPVEATTPLSLSSGIQPALEQPRKIEEIQKKDTLNTLREYRKENYSEYRTSQEQIIENNDTAEIGSTNKFSLTTDHQEQCEELSGINQPQYTVQRKSPVEFEVQIKDTSGLHQIQKPVQRSRDDMVNRRKNRYNLKLQKLYEEEANLKHEMSLTTDPSRLTRLQQKINCAVKKIENTLKYSHKYIGIENSGLCANPAPLRIQVRRDLVQKIPSSEDVDSVSVSPLRPTNETDMALTRRSPPVPSYPVITIVESDSASSGEESDIDDGKSLDNIKPHLQPDEEMKFNVKDMSEDDSKILSPARSPSPDCKAIEMLDKLNVSLNLNSEMTNNNVEYFNKNLPPVCEDVPTTVNTAPISIPRVAASPNTASMGIPRLPPNTYPASPNISPLLREMNFSPSSLNIVANQKSPNLQYGARNSSSTPDQVDKERSKPSCECLPCLQSNAAAATNNTEKFEADNVIPSVVSVLRTPTNNTGVFGAHNFSPSVVTGLHTPTNNTAKFEANNVVPTVVSDLRTPRTLRRIAIQENPNVDPVPNYPVHRTDYATKGNVPSMFSKDNGGANINLSSPLQGHSALPLPPPYYRNLTAQGYPMPAEPRTNSQTSQWHNQNPPTKSSMPYTPDRDSPSHSSILAAHLLSSQAPEPANFPNSIKLSSLAQTKDTNRPNPANPISQQIMTAQFPTLGNWAAQMTRGSTNRKPAVISMTDGARYKTTGSDMYKMAATAVNVTHPPNPANTLHWPSGRPGPEQLRSTQGFPGQRSIPHPYRRDYPPNSQVPQKSHNAPAGYPGSEVFVHYATNPYQQIPPGAQSNRNTEHSNSQSSRQQNMRQYQPPISSTRSLQVQPGAIQNQGKPLQYMNSMGMMPQQYLQQPNSYVQAMFSQWHSANNFQKHYINSQFNGFDGQSKPVDNNSQMNYRPVNKNVAPMQQQQPHHDNMTQHLIQNVSNVKLPNPIYNIPRNLNSVVQDGRNAEPFNLGRSFAAPHLGKVHYGSDRSITLKCSLCGTPGPRFNCFGCETAFYCNEHCQAQHWGTHYLECPKKMPKLKKVS